MVTFKLTLDDLYICTCTTGSDIILCCGDSFCKGCIARLICKKEFSKKLDNKKIEKDEPNTLRKIKINCPNCFTRSEIRN